MSENLVFERGAFVNNSFERPDIPRPRFAEAQNETVIAEDPQNLNPESEQMTPITAVAEEHLSLNQPEIRRAPSAVEELADIGATFDVIRIVASGNNPDAEQTLLELAKKHQLAA